MMSTVVLNNVEADLDECLRFGLDEKQAHQVVLVSRQTGLPVIDLLALILRTRPVLTPSVLALNFDEHVPRTLPPLSRREQRDRSMKKPTGKPWDVRRRRR